MKHEKILVVEKDTPMRKLICRLLTENGYENKSADMGRIALSLFSSERFDIVLTGLELPDMDGMELIQNLRERSQIPIIVVSMHKQDKKIAATLDAGAFDYITKPFSEVELMARIRVAHRDEKNVNDQETQSTATVGELKIDFEKRLCFLCEKEIRLTRTEYCLLLLFFKNIDRILTTQHIIKDVWGMPYAQRVETLRTHIASLRRKIETDPATPRYILTEIGVGYRLADV